MNKELIPIDKIGVGARCTIQRTLQLLLEILR